MSSTTIRGSDYASDREQAEGASARYDIQRSLGRIEGKLDSLGISFVQHARDDKDEFSIIKLRVATLEKKFWSFAGALTLLLSIFSLLPYTKHLFQ